MQKVKERKKIEEKENPEEEVLFVSLRAKEWDEFFWTREY